MLRRWILCVLLVVVAGAGVAAIGYRRPIFDRLQFLRRQRECLTYSRPPDTILVTSDPRIVRTFANDRDYASRTDPEGEHVWLRPRCLNVFPWFHSNGVSMRMSAGPDEPTVFLHERISPAGNRRLVYVESYHANALRLPAGFRWTVVRPATLFRDPSIAGESQHGRNLSGMLIPVDLSFGQPDPNDHSHFTINLVIKNPPAGGADRYGTIDCWLRDDDTVHFELRDPATTRRLVRYSKEE